MIFKMKAGGCETKEAHADQTMATDKSHSFFSRLFRTKSADSKKKALKAAPKSSSMDAVPRRRFIRVVRDSEHIGEEYQNPHVIRRYTKGYWEEHQMRKASSLEDTSRPLPYTVSGHTILKKPSFPESDCMGHATRRATFSKEVQVIVFSKLEKTATCKRMARSMPLMTFNQSCNVTDSKQSEDEQSGGEEEHSSSEVGSNDYLVQVEIAHKSDDECEIAEEARDEFPIVVSDSAVAEDVIADGQFASLVAADEKDLRTNRLKRKLSGSTDSGNSSDGTAREA